MTQETNNKSDKEPVFPYSLTIPPFGVQTYVDTKRSKTFLTLFFRKRDTTQHLAFAFPERVMEDLAAAGLTARGPVKTECVKKPDGHYFCIVEVPVETV